MNTTLKCFANDFIELLFPKLCLVCGNNLLSQEKIICLHCLHHLPRTNFHLEKDNPVAELFYGRVHIELATAFYFYTKGSDYQELIHCIKYRGMVELGEFMGRQFANDLLKSNSFSSIDIVCPVPLHTKREKKRGYNQSYYIAKGIADRMEKNLSTNKLIRISNTDSQTRKGRYERWENVDGIFQISNPDDFENKHILIVDDVVTTGSTLEACANAILGSTKNTKVSIATLGFA